jgi:rod shape-determining protein MreC
LVALRNGGARFAPTRVSSLAWRAIALVALSVGIMVLDARHGSANVLRRALANIVAPLHRVVESPFALSSGVSALFTTRDSLRAQVTALEAQVREDALHLARLRAIELENERLQHLLDLSPRDATRTVTARVLQVDLDTIRQRVLVDRGSNDGIVSSQPVMDAKGVFGQTTRINSSTSEVILLSDPNHAIPVQIERTGLRTIAVGTGDPDRLALPYLPRNTDVQPGDKLVTSGLGGVFPPDLPVATVTEVKRDPSQPLVQVRATPGASLDRDREVMIVWYQPRVVATAPDTSIAAHPGKGKPRD